MPRAMADLEFRRQQWEQRYAPHVAPINRWIDELRNPYDRGWLPYVAPLHGGTEARVLSILRDPPGHPVKDGARSLEVAGLDTMNPVEATIRSASDREIGGSTGSAAGVRPAM